MNMTEKNILMQRKNSDGTYDIYYPVPANMYAVASGTNTYTVSISGISSLTEGLSIKVKFTNANTGTATLNVNSLGAKSIVKSNGNALSSGNIKAGQICHLVYTGSNFQLLGSEESPVTSVNGKTGAVGIDVSDIHGLNQRDLVLGLNAFSNYNGSIALGHQANAGDYGSIAIGENAEAPSSSVAIGYGASTSTGGNVAVGYNALAGNDQNADRAIAIGYGTEASGNYSAALGYMSRALNDDEGQLGDNNYVKNWKVQGSFSVIGSKTFEISHPKPEKRATHVIRHACVESPTAGDTLYRWEIKAEKENDIVTIDLPDYFIYLNKDVQVFVAPQGHFGAGYGVLNTGAEQLEIHCQLAGEYNILVIGTRNDENVQDWNIKGVEREIGESWTGETYVFDINEIIEVEEIKENKEVA